ncbi:MAG: hypothetical protein JXK07_04530 [Spirochaetes bacterium]|nr:hypothetical protein [Spirochaetota bacterium]MBN2770444.1 hypothetical protein [Spirochaetota bacterium]
MADFEKKLNYIKGTVLAVLFLSWPALYAKPLCPQTHGMQLGDFQVSPFVTSHSDGGFYAGSLIAASLSDRTVLMVTHPLYQQSKGGLSGDVCLGLEHYAGSSYGFLFYVSESLNLPFSESVYDNSGDFTHDYGIYTLQTSFKMIYAFSDFSIYGEFSHVFMSHNQGDLFEPLRADIFNKKTWTSLFGLSPFYADSFTSSESRAFDWCGVEAGPRTALGMLRMEVMFYYSAPYSEKKSLEDIPLEGFLPLMMVCPEVEWFYSETFSISIGAGYKFLGVSGYPRYRVYSSASVVF